MLKDTEVNRYNLLDTLRGIALINMVLYHGIWDLVYLFHIDWKWYQSITGYLWQQSICWTFILLSGFCWSLGKNPIKRGILISIGGLLVTIVTICFIPAEKVIFGVLTLIGSSMLLLVFFRKYLCNIHPIYGIFYTIILFIMTRNINYGYLGFGQWNCIKLPNFLYKNIVTAYWGFPDKKFYSTDYFSLFPWFFLFLTGYYLYELCKKKNWLHFFKKTSFRNINQIGRFSLEIYLLHQPILYIGLNCIFRFLQ